MKELFSDVPQEWHFQPWRSGGISEQLIGRSGGSFPRNCTPWHGAGGGFLAEEEAPCGNCQGTVGSGAWMVLNPLIPGNENPGNFLAQVGRRNQWRKTGSFLSFQSLGFKIFSELSSPCAPPARGSPYPSAFYFHFKVVEDSWNLPSLSAQHLRTLQVPFSE